MHLIILQNLILKIEKYKEQNQKLIKQRDLLLPRLMNGTRSKLEEDICG